MAALIIFGTAFFAWGGPDDVVPGTEDGGTHANSDSQSTVMNTLAQTAEALINSANSFASQASPESIRSMRPLRPNNDSPQALRQYRKELDNYESQLAGLSNSASAIEGEIQSLQAQIDQVGKPEWGKPLINSLKIALQSLQRARSNLASEQSKTGREERLAKNEQINAFKNGSAGGAGGGPGGGPNGGAPGSGGAGGFQPYNDANLAKSTPPLRSGEEYKKAADIGTPQVLKGPDESVAQGILGTIKENAQTNFGNPADAKAGQQALVDAQVAAGQSASDSGKEADTYRGATTTVHISPRTGARDKLLEFLREGRATRPAPAASDASATPPI